MQLFYGSYGFNANDVYFSHVRQTMRSDTGYRIGYTDNWTINFRLRADTQAELTTEINSLYSNFSVDGYDLVLKDNSGNNSAFITTSNATTSGVRINSIDFTDMRNEQYTTYVDGVITADAETVTSIASNLVYVDSFAVTGNGGPKVVILETATGSPIPQTTRQQTKVTAVQSGTATAVGAIPNFPPFLFPDLLINEQIRREVSSAIKGGKIEHTVSWMYPYQSSTYFSSNPIITL